MVNHIEHIGHGHVFVWAIRQGTSCLATSGCFRHNGESWPQSPIQVQDQAPVRTAVLSDGPTDGGMFLPRLNQQMGKLRSILKPWFFHGNNME